jgi:cell division protein ZapA
MTQFNKPNSNGGSPAVVKPRAEQSYVTVDIYDQTYHLSAAASNGTDTAANEANVRAKEHVQRLAARVDARMRAVASAGRTADSLRVAVLAALNLADELARAEERLRKVEVNFDGSDSAEFHIRAANLRGLLDSILEEEV